MTVFFNGEYVDDDKANISTADRGLLLGDGLFETLRVNQHLIEDFLAHYTRLTRSAKTLALPCLIEASTLETIIHQVIKRNHLSHAVVRVTLTRGPGPRGLLPKKNCQASLLVSAAPLPQLMAHARVMVIDHIRRNEFSPTSSHKTLNYLDNILAQQAAVQAGADYAILRNTAGHISGASCASIFAVIDDTLVTPSLDQGILPGVTRARVIAGAHHLNIKVKETRLSPQQLQNAQSLFLTNSVYNILPASLNKNQFIHNLTQRLIDIIN